MTALKMKAYFSLYSNACYWKCSYEVRNSAVINDLFDDTVRTWVYNHSIS
jgi:hypothetical protein